MRLRRAVIAIALMIAATGAGIAAASAIVDPTTGFERDPDTLLPGPAELVTGARTPDPDGPDWAVRTYVSRTGLLCAERGRVVAEVFGDLREPGGFVPRPPGPTGVCGDGAEDPVIAAVDRIAAGPATAAVTIVYGTAARPLSAVVARPEGGRPVELALGPRRSFIGRFAGLRPAESLPLTVEFADGASQSITWRAARSR